MIPLLTRALVVTLFAAAALFHTANAATFGTVIPIGGQAADIALDESRSSLYIANLTANRIDVLSTQTNTITRSIAVAAQPASLALSPDGNYLVVTHFSNFATPQNSVTVINLADSSRRTFGMGSTPLAVAFGLDDQAFLVTTSEFLLLDPVSGQTRTLETVDGLVAKTLPVEVPSLPPTIIRASISASRDKLWIYGLTDTFVFKYDVRLRQVSITNLTWSPDAGPRTVSVAPDGSYYTAGWALFDRRGTVMAQFPNPAGKLDVGTHVIDADGGVIYAQVSQAQASGSTSPSSILQVVSADNLAVLERLQLRENLSGRSVLNSSRDTVYAVSQSGVTVLPVGQRAKAPRLKFEQQDLVFRNSACVRQQQSIETAVVDMGGGQTPFKLVPSRAGITVSPDSGVTPAVVRVTIDPGVFADAKGTSVGFIDIRATGAVNVPDSLRVLVNNREPDQRGLLINIPGTLADVMGDPIRGRFLVARQNTNEVLVFDKTMKQVAALRTGNTPTSMAISPDQRYLIVGNDNSQIASVFDLDTLQPSTPIRFPLGHYPRSIATSGYAILASVRSAGGPHTIDRIEMGTRTAYTPASLGIYKNDVDLNTALAASSDGSSILIAMANGKVMLYDANVDTFVAGRKDFDKLSGTVAASSSDLFVVDNHVLNSSLVPIADLEQNSGAPSGFLFIDNAAFRTTSPGAGQAGMMSRVNMSQMQTMLPTRMTESPLMPNAQSNGFIRTLAELGNRDGLISLTTSGVTVLPWNYDASYAPPRIDSVLNAADRSQNIAPGSLISIFGSQLSPTPGLAADPALADALAESCLTVNGSLTPVIFAATDRINAQVPWNATGDASLILRTPGGSSDTYRLRIVPGAPSVFRSGTAGPDTGIATIIRGSNNELVTLSNPVHPGDDLVIYATGLGRTDPEVPVGTPAPFEPLARALNTPAISLGGVALPVYYAGLTPGLVGVYQINVVVPRTVPTGFDMPLRIAQGATDTTVPVRVVK